MAHLLMYSTNHTVCRRSACPYAHALRVHLQHHVIGSSTACLQSPCTISVFQALAEALTTSKGMVGRQLLSCSDLDSALTPGWVLSECAKIVRAVEATWAKASKLATDLADSFMGEVRKLGSQIECAAPLPPQRGEPRCGGDNGPAHFPGRSGILAQCADMEPGATWQECLRCSGGSGQRHCGVCHEVI